MHVEAVERGTPAFERFVELPYRLHGDDPGWIPPLRSSVRRDLAPENPWFSHGHLQHYLATRRGVAVARATAFLDRHLRDEDDQPTGTVGLFESVDGEAASGVLSAALQWLREQGARRILGPVSFSIWHDYRFRVSGHDLPAFWGEPTNPPAYPGWFEAAGFRAARHYVTSVLPSPTLREIEEHDRSSYEALRAAGHRFRSLDLRRFSADLRLLYELLVPQFRDFLGWTELPWEEFRFRYGGMRHVVDPQLVWFAFSPDDRPLGFTMALPDLAPSLRPMRGHDSLPARLRFLWGRRRVDTARLANIGVLPSARRLGLGTALNHLVARSVRQRGYRHALMGLSAVANPSVRFARGAEAPRRYALYELRP